MQTFQLGDCELYNSCETCPICLAAIYWARCCRVYYGNTRHDAAHIDFDDDHLCRELARPIALRKIPMKQILRNEAQVAFADSIAKTDKIRY